MRIMATVADEQICFTSLYLFILSFSLYEWLPVTGSHPLIEDDSDINHMLRRLLVEQRLLRLEELLDSFFEFSKIVSEACAPELGELSVIALLEEPVRSQSELAKGTVFGAALKMRCRKRGWMHRVSLTNFIQRIFREAGEAPDGACNRKTAYANAWRQYPCGVCRWGVCRLGRIRGKMKRCILFYMNRYELTKDTKKA